MKRLKQQLPECITLLIFTILHTIILYYHEPFFDEVLAWQIGRSASYKDILFTIPPYEGHTPFWSLLLSVPAKLNFSFELSIKLICLIFIITAAAIFLFKSKLPRLIKILLTFNYFLFYQYGIMLRPYCLLYLSIVLLSINFDARKEHPWRIALILTLSCLSSAFGMLMAGGIAVGMVWELVEEGGFKNFFTNLFKDSRTLSLLTLLLIAICLIIQFYPPEDSYSMGVMPYNSILVDILTLIFTIPLNIFILDNTWYPIEALSVHPIEPVMAEYAISMLLGIIFWILVILFSSKKNLKFLLITYILFSLFSATIYFSIHHIGIPIFMFMFWLEQMFRDGTQFEI